VVLYTPVADRTFIGVAQRADRFFSLAPASPSPLLRARRGGKMRHLSGPPRGQTTLEGF
jgi:hypothetical protein